MSKGNRFALLTLDDDCDNEKKSSKPADKKNTQNKGGNAGTKKAPRRKKSSQVAKNATNISEEEVEKRLTAIQDLTYEEAIEEAIINSKITFEEEHAKQAEAEFEPAKGKNRKKKPQVVAVGTRGRHGVTMSLADFQAAEYTNGAFVKQMASQETSPPPLQQQRATPANHLSSNRGDDLFESSHREAKRLLQVEKRQEDLQKTMRSRAFEYGPTASSEAAEEAEGASDPFGDPSKWREQLQEKDKELSTLRAKFEALQQERNELHRYFQITENKSAAQLAIEVEKLRKLNAELNNNLVETCIELEKERSRVHELEKNQSNRSGRTQRASENES